MRFIGADNELAKGRRFVSGATGVSEEEVKDPTKLAEIIRGLQRRVTDAETLLPPEAIEFEMNVPASGTVSIPHNFNSAVRWYVSAWTQQDGVSYPEAAPALVQDASSDAQTLVLRSYVRGRAVIRVEPSFAALNYGVTVVPAPPVVVPPTEYKKSLLASVTTGNVTATDTGLKFPMLAGETWDVKMNLICSSTSASGMRFQITAPVGSLMDGMHYSCSTGLTVRLYLRANTASMMNVLGSAVHTAAGVVMDDQIHVRLTAALDGDFNLQFARVAAASTATVGVRSSLIALKVTEV